MAPKWVVTQEVPPAAELSDEMIESYVETLQSQIDSINEQLAENTDGDDSDLQLQLVDTEFKLELACQDPRVVCEEEQTSSSVTDAGNSNSNSMMIIGVVALIIIGALLGGMFLLRGRGNDELRGFQWADTTLPARDVVANSMYGGTQQIFQQPLQPQYQPQQYQPAQYGQPQPTARPAPPQNIPQPPVQRGPPLPPGGLPSGWSMAQWEYYGQQYLDRLQKWPFIVLENILNP